MSADHRDDEHGETYDYGLPEPPWGDNVVLPFRGAPSSRPQAEHDSWDFIDLNDPQWDEDPVPPDLHDFLYSGLRHVISGTPGSAKTLIIYRAAVDIIRKTGRLVVVLDFEMGAKAAKLLLRELDATPEEIAQIRFATPETPPKDALQAIIELDPVLVIIDASAGAYRASGLDDNKRQDVEQFAHVWVNPLWQAGIATALLDHLTKNPETRGGFVIGSERKVGQTDVHIGLAIDEKHPLKRGGHATATVTVHKDRRAFLRRPIAFFADITSDTVTHHLEVVLRHPEEMPTAPGGEKLPTIKMEQISRYLESLHGDSASKAQIRSGVGGNAAMADRALDILISNGHVKVDPQGAGKAHLHTLVRPYTRPPEPPSETPTTSTLSEPRPNHVQTGSPDHTASTASTASVPLKGDKRLDVVDVGLVRTPETPTASGDPELTLEELVEKYEHELGGGNA